MLLYINRGGGHSSPNCHLQDDADSQASTTSQPAMTNDLANVESAQTTVDDVAATPPCELDGDLEVVT